jgi:F-type H+-transporting ATPase subunit delta
VSAVARRYAKALFELAQEGKDFESVGRELSSLAQAFSTDPLARFATDTTLDRATRRTVAERIAESLGLPGLLEKFLRVLAQNNRLSELAAIQAGYQRLEDRALGQIRSRVQSAEPLSDASRRQLLAIFEQLTGKRIVAETKTDPALLAGVMVELQGRVFDGTLRTRLERLRRSLAG